jgi:hypothetical protein
LAGNVVRFEPAIEICGGGHAAREVSMKRYITALLCALSAAIGLAGVTLSGQAGNTIAAQVAAAHAVAGDTWLTIESELCGPAQGGPGRAAPL